MVQLTDYIIATRSESNISDNYKEIIKDLFKLSEFFNHQKSFKEITRDDLLFTLTVCEKPNLQTLFISGLEHII